MLIRVRHIKRLTNSSLIITRVQRWKRRGNCFVVECIFDVLIGALHRVATVRVIAAGSTRSGGLFAFAARLMAICFVSRSTATARFSIGGTEFLLDTRYER